MSIGRLIKKLDLDLIERMKSGNVHKHVPAKRLKPPRAASSYRAARRNHELRDLGTTWSGAKPDGTHHVPRVRANRSRRWAPIKGRLYAHGVR